MHFHVKLVKQKNILGLKCSASPLCSGQAACTAVHTAQTPNTHCPRLPRILTGLASRPECSPQAASVQSGIQNHHLWTVRHRVNKPHVQANNSFTSDSSKVIFSPLVLAQSRNVSSLFLDKPLLKLKATFWGQNKTSSSPGPWNAEHTLKVICSLPHIVHTGLAGSFREDWAFAGRNLVPRSLGTICWSHCTPG